MTNFRRRTIGALAAVLVLGTLVSVAPRAGAATPKPVVSYTYDADGRLATVTSSAGTATYHYDKVGNLTSVTRSTGPSRRNGDKNGPPRHPSPSLRLLPPPTPVTASRSPSPGTASAPSPPRTACGSGRSSLRSSRPRPAPSPSPRRPGSGGRVVVQTPGGSAQGGTVSIAPLAGSEPQASTLASHRRVQLLSATRGVTAVSGLVATNRGRPLAGVRVSISNGWNKAQSSTTTDRDGRFLLTDLAGGHHELVVDGNHVPGGTRYGLYAEPLNVPEGRTTKLSWTTYLTPLARAVSLPAQLTKAVVLTSAKMPGLEVTLPAGTVIRDHYGKVVHRVSITPIDIARPPVPLAPGMPDFFTFQPGDATFSGPGIQVTYPNATHKPAATEVAYVADDPTYGAGWSRYGSGHVTANGDQIVSDATVRFHKAILLGYMNPLTPPSVPPPSCGCENGGSQPVNLPTGLDLYEATDLTLPDVEPATLTRTYRPLDDLVRTFGMGMSDSFDYYLYPIGEQDAPTGYELIRPDGSRIIYDPTSTTGIYQAVGTPTNFYDSTLSTSGTFPGNFASTISLPDGTVYSFGLNDGMLEQMTDRYGNAITITRSTAFPGNEGPQTVTTSNGRWMEFTYGLCLTGTTPTDCVTSVTDNIGQTVSYQYDTATGQMIQSTAPDGGITTYAWAPCTSTITCTEMTSSTDPLSNTNSTIYNATGQATSQTDPDGGTWTFAYAVGPSGTETTTVTNPRHAKDVYTYDINGYPQKEVDAKGTSVQETTTDDFDSTTHLLDKTTDPLGRTTAYTYDAQGNVTKMVQLSGTANPSTTSYTYEPEFSRITSITDPDGHTWSEGYTGLTGETITDPEGNKTTVALNAEGQPTSVTDALSKTTYLSYLHDDLVAVTDPLGHVTSAYYDAEDRPLAVTDPLGNVTQRKLQPAQRAGHRDRPPRWGDERHLRPRRRPGDPHRRQRQHDQLHLHQRQQRRAGEDPDRPPRESRPIRL